MADKRDIVIIGGGPGGYLAAMRAAQLRRSVTLVEQDRVGGTCINYGCIPTKYLLHQTKILKEVGGTKTLEGPVGEVRLNWAKVQQGRQAVVDQLVKGLVFLLEKGKVEIVKAPARIRADRTVAVQTPAGERVIEGDTVIVATGSQAAGLPFLRVDGQTVITSTEALTLAEVPKSLLVIGAGAIGLEMGSIYRRLGTDVSVLEILPQILPGSDKEAVIRLERALRKQGLKIFTEMRIEEAVVAEGGVTLKGFGLKDQRPSSTGRRRSSSRRGGSRTRPTSSTASPFWRWKEASSRSMPLSRQAPPDSTPSATSSAASSWPTRPITTPWSPWITPAA